MSYENGQGLADAASDAICLRAGVKLSNVNPQASRFAGMKLCEILRNYVVMKGVTSAMSLGNAEVISLSSRRNWERYSDTVALTQTTSDLQSIMADAMNKSFRQAYIDAAPTWQRWARRATAPDFKTIKRTALSDVPGLSARTEGGGLSYVNVGDSKETYALAEYANAIKLSRRLLINDDLEAFGKIPMLQARAAARLEDDVAYAILTNGHATAMADTGNLFNATAVSTPGGHANLVSSGTTLTVANLAATEKLLTKQKGPNGAQLELRIKHLVVPTSIYRKAQQEVASLVDASKSNDAINPFANEGIILTPSNRLDDNSATAWYALADYNAIDTVEVCFLEDEPTPVLKQETDFDTDDVKFAVRHTVAAKAIDFRGMVKNNGA